MGLSIVKIFLVICFIWALASCSIVWNSGTRSGSVSKLLETEINIF